MKIGTAIAAITSAVGVTPCRGCRRRKEFMDGLSWKAYRLISPRSAERREASAKQTASKGLQVPSNQMVDAT